MRTRVLATLTTAALSGALLVGVAGPSTAAPAPPAAAAKVGSAATAPVQINQSDIQGVFTLTNFVNQNGQLVAVGTFTGTVLDNNGVPQEVTNATVTSVVGVASANGPACTILDLTLGPLHLDLLGLVVDLNQVHLTITAQPGPGNLLGNLLCGIANALNGGGGGLANLLNRLLGL